MISVSLILHNPETGKQVTIKQDYKEFTYQEGVDVVQRFLAAACTGDPVPELAPYDWGEKEFDEAVASLKAAVDPKKNPETAPRGTVTGSYSFLDGGAGVP